MWNAKKKKERKKENKKERKILSLSFSLSLSLSLSYRIPKTEFTVCFKCLKQAERSFVIMAMWKET